MSWVDDSPSPLNGERGENLRQAHISSRGIERRAILSFRNLQRSRPINLRLLRRIILRCVRELLNVESFDLGIQIVNAAEISRVNEQFLQHAGPTDVITFDYREVSAARSEVSISGDLYVCIDEAIRQAKRFRTSCPQELVRYIVHGILHLLGFDDRTPRLRQRMKRLENRLVKTLAMSFSFSELELPHRTTHG
jgi:probable rRNA maturation factor